MFCNPIKIHSKGMSNVTYSVRIKDTIVCQHFLFDRWIWCVLGKCGSCFALEHGNCMQKVWKFSFFPHPTCYFCELSVVGSLYLLFLGFSFRFLLIWKPYLPGSICRLRISHIKSLPSTMWKGTCTRILQTTFYIIDVYYRTNMSTILQI